MCKMTTLDRVFLGSYPLTHALPALANGALLATVTLAILNREVDERSTLTAKAAFYCLSTVFMTMGSSFVNIYRNRKFDEFEKHSSILQLLSAFIRNIILLSALIIMATKDGAFLELSKDDTRLIVGLLMGFYLADGIVLILKLLSMSEFHKEYAPEQVSPLFMTTSHATTLMASLEAFVIFCVVIVKERGAFVNQTVLVCADGIDCHKESDAVLAAGAGCASGLFAIAGILYLFALLPIPRCYKPRVIEGILTMRSVLNRNEENDYQEDDYVEVFN